MRNSSSSLLATKKYFHGDFKAVTDKMNTLRSLVPVGSHRSRSTLVSNSTLVISSEDVMINNEISISKRKVLKYEPAIPLPPIKNFKVLSPLPQDKSFSKTKLKKKFSDILLPVSYTERK